MCRSHSTPTMVFIGRLRGSARKTIRAACKKVRNAGYSDEEISRVTLIRATRRAAGKLQMPVGLTWSIRSGSRPIRRTSEWGRP
jgi:hypothetical protein